MKIPSNNQWTQDNSGDVLGILGDTTNMAMDTIGKATLARKAVAFTGDNKNAEFGYPLNINYFDGDTIILTDNSMFEVNFPNYSLTEINDFNTYLGSDSVVYNNLYTVSSGNTGTTIHTWNGTSDTQQVSGLTGNVPHPMDVFGVRLVVGDANTVRTYTTSFVSGTTLTLPTEYQVTTIRAVNNYIYIGTKNLNGKNAKIFVWNGESSLYDYECEVGSPWVFSMTPYLSTVAAVTSAGQLGIVNGTTFQQLAAFPVYNDPHARWKEAGGLTLNGKVFNRGMTTIGETIYLNVDGNVDSGIIPDMKSGIWVYDPQVGLYHRSNNSTDEVVFDNSLTRSGDVLTTSADHSLKTGDAVSFTTISNLDGITNGVTYYAQVDSVNEIKLAPTRKSIQEGRYISLRGTPNSLDVLAYAQNNDNGTVQSTSGFIAPLTYLENPAKNLISEILWGSRIDNKDGTGVYRAYTFSDSLNIGSFSTQRIYTNNIDQTWKGIYPILDGLITDEEQIVVKVQTDYQVTPEPLTGVWLAPNILNSNSTDDYEAFRDIEPGYEIVLTEGYGRGRTAHVTSIDVTAGTVSLTLDESAGTINKTCGFTFTTFKKIGAYTRENKEKEKVKVALDNVVSPWIVLKFELRGFGTAVNTLELTNAINTGGN